MQSTHKNRSALRTAGSDDEIETPPLSGRVLLWGRSIYPYRLQFQEVRLNLLNISVVRIISQQTTQSKATQIAALGKVGQYVIFVNRDFFPQFFRVI